MNNYTSSTIVISTVWILYLLTKLTSNQSHTPKLAICCLREIVKYVIITCNQCEFPKRFEHVYFITRESSAYSFRQLTSLATVRLVYCWNKRQEINQLNVFSNWSFALPSSIYCSIKCTQPQQGIEIILLNQCIIHGRII